MAFDFDEIWDGRQMQDDLSKGFQEYTSVWRCFTDDALAGPKAVREEAEAFVGDRYSDQNGDVDNLSWTVKVECRQDQDDPRYWIVLANYSNEVEPDPVDDPPEIQIDFEPYQRPFIRDITGATILNAAYDPFDPPVEGDDDRLTIRITRNENPDTFTLVKATLYNGTVNSDTWEEFEPGTLKMRISAQKMYKSELLGRDPYWRVTYTIQRRKDADTESDAVVGWQPHILNRGYRYFVGGDKIEFRDPDGTKVSQPKLLAVDGQALTPESSTPTYVDYDIYPTSVFADLALPSV